MAQIIKTKREQQLEAMHDELFAYGYVDHLRSDFIKYLRIRNSEYHIFRLIHYFTVKELNGGYLTLSRSKIAATLGRSMTTVDEGLRNLCRRGLIIRERISRDGREIVAYRVDLIDLEARIAKEKLRELAENMKESAEASAENAAGENSANTEAATPTQKSNESTGANSQKPNESASYPKETTKRAVPTAEKASKIGAMLARAAAERNLKGEVACGA